MHPLIDSFGRAHTYLRISVTDRCNLLCRYCMPPGGIETKHREEILTLEEIERVARLFASMGISKIRLTGGEPLVRKDIPHLVRRLSGFPRIITLGMTTNGVLLQEHAAELKDAGLTHLNISLDTLRRERFEKIAQRANFDDVLAGVDAALRVGFSPLKLNMVVMGGVNEDELADFVEFARNKPINVRFIEYMPFKSNAWDAATFFPFAQMMKNLRKRYDLVPIANNDDTSSVAKEYRIPGHDGTIGFVTSMSDHFCANCNRIRLMADGSVRSCLFRAPEVNLRAALRGGATDEILASLVRTSIVLKPFAHPPVEELSKQAEHAMIEIGG